MTAAAELQTVLTIPTRFRGPEGAANGGWIAGTLANLLTGMGHTSAVEVTLHRPVPLETALSVEHVGCAVTLFQEGQHLAEAIPVTEELTAPPFVPFTEAARAEAGFPGHHGHAIADCFACGLREPGDGLRIFPGPVAGTDLVAAGWRVSRGVTDEQGVVPDRIIWAALDCVTSWAHRSERPALLGRLTGQVYRRANPGSAPGGSKPPAPRRLTGQVYRRVYPLGTYSVVARVTGRTRRELFGESAVYEVDGTLVAAARATWIIPRGRAA